MERELNKINFLGFSTFGEQYNAIHINQTLTGVVFGGETEQVFCHSEGGVPKNPMILFNAFLFL